MQAARSVKHVTPCENGGLDGYVRLALLDLEAVTAPWLEVVDSTELQGSFGLQNRYDSWNAWKAPEVRSVLPDP